VRLHISEAPISQPIEHDDASLNALALYPIPIPIGVPKRRVECEGYIAVRLRKTKLGLALEEGIYM
jgi:hypothetical protein